MAKDPLAEEVGESPFFEIEAAIESALAGSGVTAGFSGLPALSAGDQEQTLGAIKRLTPISLVLVLLLFRIVEKRPGGMLSVAAVLILAIGAALGAVGLLTGKLTVMETFFGVTVFGLGIDFAVHLFVRQREELAHGRSFEDRRCGGPCPAPAAASSPGASRRRGRSSSRRPRRTRWRCI